MNALLKILATIVIFVVGGAITCGGNLYLMGVMHIDAESGHSAPWLIFWFVELVIILIGLIGFMVHKIDNLKYKKLFYIIVLGLPAIFVILWIFAEQLGLG